MSPTAPTPTGWPRRRPCSAVPRSGGGAGAAGRRHRAFKLPKIDVTPGGAGRPAARTARAPGATVTWCWARSAIFLYVGGEVVIGSFLVNYFKEPEIGGLTEAEARTLGLVLLGRRDGRPLHRHATLRSEAGQGAGRCTPRPPRCWSLIAMSRSGPRGHVVASSRSACSTRSCSRPSSRWRSTGSGKHTSQGSGILCMAIVGGAIVPVVQGAAGRRDRHPLRLRRGGCSATSTSPGTASFRARRSQLAPESRLAPPPTGRAVSAWYNAGREKRRLIKGINRAPARAMLKATGLNDADLEKPLIAVANTWTDATPCNLHLRELGGEGEGGHPRRGRHADRVQHHRRLRRHQHGDRGDARVAGSRAR